MINTTVSNPMNLFSQIATKGKETCKLYIKNDKVFSTHYIIVNGFVCIYYNPISILFKNEKILFSINHCVDFKKECIIRTDICVYLPYTNMNFKFEIHENCNLRDCKDVINKYERNTMCHFIQDILCTGTIVFLQDNFSKMIRNPIFELSYSGKDLITNMCLNLPEDERIQLIQKRTIKVLEILEKDLSNIDV